MYGLPSVPVGLSLLLSIIFHLPFMLDPYIINYSSVTNVRIHYYIKRVRCPRLLTRYLLLIHCSRDECPPPVGRGERPGVTPGPPARGFAPCTPILGVDTGFKTSCQMAHCGVCYVMIMVACLVVLVSWHTSVNWEASFLCNKGIV
jgi:hypothetical protein